MKRKKIHKKLDIALDTAYEVGYENGYDSGHDDGWDARFENVTYRLNSLFNTYMATNKLREAKTVKEIAEYLDFFVTLEEEE